jgi:hypothetical protein
MTALAAPALVGLGLMLQQPVAEVPASPPEAPVSPVPAPEGAPSAATVHPSLQTQPPLPMQLSSTQTLSAPPLPRTGLFAAGLGIDLLQIGALQVISSGATSQGVVVGTGVEIDLGTRTALRVPIEIAYAGSSNNDAAGVERSTVFFFAGLAPGVVYRFRTERQQRWTPYLGGAVRLGAFMFGRDLLGVPPNPPPATMQEFTRLGAAPDLAAGVLFTPARWFSLRIAVDYTYIFVAHTSVHVLSEAIAPRFSF